MKKALVIIVVVLINIQLEAQNYKFGKVTAEEVGTKIYEKDSTADAVRLYKHRHTYFDFRQGDGWVIITEVHERIKILNKDGLHYATKKIGLYKTEHTKEFLSGIKGITYNVVGGKLQKEKLKKNGIFKEERSEYWDVQSISMPNVSVGSVVEWSYKMLSPYWKIEDLEVQQEIPTDYYFAKVQIPKYFNFNKRVKGTLSAEPKTYNHERTLRVRYAGNGKVNGGIIDDGGMGNHSVTEYITEYALRDIPALKAEPFVNNINNYRILVNYELSGTKFPGGSYKSYARSWKDVVNRISKNDEFGKQLNKTKFLRAKGEEIKMSYEEPSSIAQAVFHFVKTKMSWNGNYGKYTEKGIKEAFEESVGNVADINLLLVGLLRESGLKAYPVLISTRKHGIPLFPTLEGFNYVVACAEVDGNMVLLDATDKDMPIGLLPPRALNWEGTLVLDSGESMKINLYPKTLSQFNTMLNVVINEDGSIEGKRSSSANNLDGYALRKICKDRSVETLTENIINDFEYDDVSDLEIKNMEDLSKSASQIYNFELDDGVQLAGDEIYFSPLFDLAIESNPFVSEERLYPVDFIYPKSRKRIVNIKLPEGYDIVSMPEPIKMNLPDGLGSFLFNISKTPTGINVMSSYNINATIIPAHFYQELKEFYNQRVKKETEKVVLKKI
jgi:hypothetical protein